MRVIVVGGGKVGYYLAKTLLEHEHEPVLIEQDKHLCRKVANELDITIICGDGTSIDILEMAIKDGAEALIGVTGEDENNLIACQLAKKRFNIPRTVAKVNNPKNAEIMKQLGVDIPISSTDNIARLLEREVDTAAIKRIMSLNRGEATLSELQLPDNYKLDGKSLQEIKLPEGSILVTITRNGELLIPRGNTVLKSGDKVVAIAQNRVLHRLAEILEIED